MYTCTDNRKAFEDCYGEGYVLYVVQERVIGLVSVTMHDCYIRVFEQILTLQNHDSLALDHGLHKPQPPLYQL